jgi:hypothetical protein
MVENKVGQINLPFIGDYVRFYEKNQTSIIFNNGYVNVIDDLSFNAKTKMLEMHLKDSIWTDVDSRWTIISAEELRLYKLSLDKKEKGSHGKH